VGPGPPCQARQGGPELARRSLAPWPLVWGGQAFHQGAAVPGHSPGGVNAAGRAPFPARSEGHCPRTATWHLRCISEVPSGHLTRLRRGSEQCAYSLLLSVLFAARSFTSLEEILCLHLPVCALIPEGGRYPRFWEPQGHGDSCGTPFRSTPSTVHCSSYYLESCVPSCIP